MTSRGEGESELNPGRNEGVQGGVSGIGEEEEKDGEERTQGAGEGELG